MVRSGNRYGVGPVCLLILLFLTIVLYLSVSLLSVSAAGRADLSGVREDDRSFFDDDDFKITHINSQRMQRLTTLYVIPGGGSDGSESGYPLWTKQRVIAAHQHYLQYSQKQDTGVFLALSAGSLNNGNKLLPDNRIIFECQHVIHHLTELGIDPDIVFGDILSWDTVTNAHTLRLVLEGILVYQKHIRDSPLRVEVFISDFHAARVQATFEWVLGLKPSLDRRVELNINVVDSAGVNWGSPEAFQARIEHERQGVELVRRNAKSIKTVKQFHAFLVLGGHLGLTKYLRGNYVKSSGGGW